MAYTLRPNQSYASKGTRISNRQGAELLSSIQRKLENKIRQRNFPAVVTMDEVKSGGGLFAQKLPMLVIRHPNPPFKYREIGVIVNGDLVTFPLWGRDVQEERQRNKNGFGLVASLVLPGRNEFQAQNELAWLHDVVDMINEGFVSA